MKRDESVTGMKNESVYLCYLLRHHPEDVGLEMDVHGWVSVDDLIYCISKRGKYTLKQSDLERIVLTDNKGRYRFNEDHTRIKCCQGHSIPWVIPELTYGEPPKYLYHGSNTAALKKIEADGAIRKMKRHAVHMQADEAQAWRSAERWHLTPVVLKIDAKTMAEDGYAFGMADNGVWCTESVPVDYICERLYH